MSVETEALSPPKASLDLLTLTSGLPTLIAERVTPVLRRIVAAPEEGGLGAAVFSCWSTFIGERLGQSTVASDGTPTIMVAALGRHDSIARQIDTVFHEAVHLTGLPQFESRFRKLPEVVNSLEYFVEDVVAWKGAQLLCDATGVSTLPDPEDYSTIDEARIHLKDTLLYFRGEYTNADQMMNILAKNAVGFFFK